MLALTLCIALGIFSQGVLACKYNGTEYNIGDKFQSLDGCNDCVCGPIGVICTKMECKLNPTAAPRSCSQNVNGVIKTHADGESYPSADGCNMCVCQNGRSLCTLKFCSKDSSCTDPATGRVYKGGEQFQSSDGCNTCNCFNSVISCTEMACNPTSQCFDAVTGKTYTAGQMFTALDGCNSCTCKNGVIVCTKKFCPSTDN